MTTKKPDVNDLLRAGKWDSNFHELFEGPAQSKRDDAADLDPDEEIVEVTADKPKRPPMTVLDGGALDKRPDVQLVADTHITTEQMTACLTDDPMLYQRAGALVYITRFVAVPEDETEENKKLTIEPGTPAVSEMPLSLLIDRVSKHGRCVRFVKKGKTEKWVHTEPPSKRVNAVRESKNWPRIRPLVGVLEAPSMRPDGSCIQEGGYDRRTGYLYEPNAAFLPIPDKPTHDQACTSYQKLSELFGDFPYVNDAHRSAVIAALITVLARPAIRGSVPCWLFDSASPRCGKSKQTDILSLIFSGRPASRMTYPENDEELEKAISSFALAGAPVINFDNVARAYGGAPLDKVITAVDQVDMRILGRSEIRTVAWRAVVFASGNNVHCRGDMLPRVLSPRLETTLDNPEQRDDFRYPDILGHALENRERYVRYALTILRGWVHAGKPKQATPKWGGFEAWSALVPPALVWAGGSDPMLARRGLEGDDDPDRANTVALLLGWEGLCNALGRATTGLTAREAVAHLYPKEQQKDPLHDPLREVIELVSEAKPGVPPPISKLGAAIRRNKSRPLQGRKFITDGNTGGVSRWRVVPSSG